jgi:hypothetical protein
MKFHSFMRRIQYGDTFESNLQPEIITHRRSYYNVFEKNRTVTQKKASIVIRQFFWGGEN